MESLQSLEEKLSLYRSQLGQVDELLSYDKNNEQFLKLKDDLKKVIALTETLKEQALSIQGNVVETEPSSSGNNGADSDNDSKYSLGDEDDGSVSATPRTLQVGDRVEVTGGEYPFAGIITEVISPGEFKVKYYAYDAEVSLPLSSLQRLSKAELKANEVVEGMKCQCKYAVDQQYYDASITTITDRGYVVTYTEYGNTEEVPLEYLRPVMTLSKGGHTDESSKDHKNHGFPKEKDLKDEKKIIPIPDKLKILPTDTEEEKARKKKKIKIIKNHNRKVEQDLESAQVAQSWQKFVNKKTIKRTATGIPKHESMFASSEAGRVGVINSGKGMTNFIERKKYKFDGIDGQEEHDD